VVEGSQGGKILRQMKMDPNTQSMQNNVKKSKFLSQRDKNRITQQQSATRDNSKEKLS